MLQFYSKNELTSLKIVESPLGKGVFDGRIDEVYNLTVILIIEFHY